MKLSIIIPVYNVEKTLRRCVVSVVEQMTDDMEIILVDDGSLDASGELAELLSTQYQHITVFHKKNGGLSDARNFGISRAHGEYITFVDSDDELAANTLQPLLLKIRENPQWDILEYPVLLNPGTQNEYLFCPGIKEYNNALSWLSDYGFEHCWAWNKIFRKQLFDNARFPSGKVFEDTYFMGEMLKQKPRIAITDKGLYMYYWNENGITSYERKNGLLRLLEAQIYVVKSLGLDTRHKQWHRLYLNMFTSQLYAYRKTGKILLWSQPVVIRKYVGNNDMLKALALDILGLKTACKLFKLLSR